MAHDIAWMAWDPARNLFTIPWINRPVGWYGILFALGFAVGYLIMVHLFSKRLAQEGAVAPRETALRMTDGLCWFVILGTVIGARLGHVFFYGWPFYRDHPIEIFKVWEGGLASHGGAVGVLIALALYLRFGRRYMPSLTYLGLVDLIAIPTAFVAFCIRLGNFFNQEVVGTVTSVPWAVVFVHPMEVVGVLPRHPAQLYEAFFYLFVFIFLYRLWARSTERLADGTLIGYFFCLMFGFRIVVEWVKEPQGVQLLDGWIQAGQLLSVPFVLVGAWLLCKGHKGQGTKTT